MKLRLEIQKEYVEFNRNERQILRGVCRKNDWIRWIVDGFGLIVFWIDGGGWRSTGDDVGSAPNLAVIIGESALFDGANGRFFKIDALLVLTIQIKKRHCHWFNWKILPSLIRTGGVGLRSSSVYNIKIRQ